MLTKEELPECPVATTVQLVGSKWKLLILRNLLARPWRFNELRKDLEGISQKVLTDSLRSLEEDGIVQRKVYPQVPPRVEYSLTPPGGVHAAHLGCHGAVGQRLQSRPGTGGGLHPGVKTERDVPARVPRFFFSRLTAPGKCGMMPPGKNRLFAQSFLEFDFAFWARRQGVVLK